MQSILNMNVLLVIQRTRIESRSKTDSINLALGAGEAN